MWEEEYEGIIIDRITYRPCELCLTAFGRVRHTKYYCDKCGNAMCMGEHGNFAQSKKGICVICGEQPGYRKK